MPLFFGRANSLTVKIDVRVHLVVLIKLCNKFLVILVGIRISECKLDRLLLILELIIKA